MIHDLNVYIAVRHSCTVIPVLTVSLHSYVLSMCIISSGNAQDTALVRTLREGCEYDTVTLKWCTPRGASASEMHHCTVMHRITPVDVNR